MDVMSQIDRDKISVTLLLLISWDMKVCCELYYLPCGKTTPLQSSGMIYIVMLVSGSDNSNTEYRHMNYITCVEIDMWESVEVSRFTESQLRIEFYDIKVRAREMMRSL